MKNTLLWIWQLPQNILGLALWGIIWMQKRVVTVSNYDYSPYVVIWTNHTVFGVSLGRYVIVGEQARMTSTTVPHEIGHCKQSRYFGPLYLFAVGIPSVIRNYRLPRRPGDWADRQRWYYSGWPEKQADRLGGVKRTY